MNSLLPLKKARVVWILVNSLFLAFLAFPVHAEERRLTLQEALDLASNRLDVEAALADASAASHEAESVRRLARLPQLSVEAAYQELDEARSLATPIGNLNLGPAGTRSTRFELLQPLYDPAVRGRKDRAAALAATASKHLAERVRHEITAEAGLAFLDVLRIDARLNAVRAFLKSVDGRADQVTAWVEEGRALQADLMRIRLATEDARLAEFQLLKQRRVALANLVRTLGLPESSRLEPTLGESWTTEVNEDGVAIAKALANRPDLAALAAEQEARQFEAAGIRAERLPRLDARVAWEHLDPSPFTRSDVLESTIAITWKPFANGTRGPRAAAVDERRRGTVARLEEARRGVRVEVLAALADIAVATEAVEVRRADVERASETLRVESERYEAGRSTLDDVLEDEAALRDRMAAAELAALDHTAGWLLYRLAVGAF